MDDLDPPREEPGAADTILRSLEAHGLHWDEAVMYQSQRNSAYQAALEMLNAKGLLFYCECSRAMQGPEGVCCGNCSYRQEWVGEPRAIRLRVPAETVVHFHDLVQGDQTAMLGETNPDFIVRRKDGLNAYQLAVVIDDAAQGITHVVRGSDLLDTTPKQVFLQQTSGHSTPAYAHLPVITTLAGQKFSKQNHAPPLNSDKASRNLRQALAFLQQPPPPKAIVTVPEIIAFAVEAWSLAAVPKCLAIPASTLAI